ncbi:restriction endonuclease subunit S [Bacillus altitudinis]|uniref:restriction endonuclease subunit S n=1 Tax=Bacillus altitudinis TaxID=293387 RepID=UPI003F7B8658
MSDKITRLPQIRFAGFTDDWEQHSLSKVGDFLRTSVDPQATPCASFIEYSMPSYDNGRSPETVFGDSMQSMRLKISGDVLLINKLNVRQKRIWFVEDAPSNAVASSEFMPFTSTEIDLAFLEQLMLLDKTTRDLESISSGTSNSQKRITPSDVLKYLIKLPVGRPEQEKIGSFFKNIDNLINHHQRKLELLKDTKKSLLQKMFPKDGANVPEIRFAGFSDVWGQRKLESICGKIRNAFVGVATPYYVEDGHFYLESNNVKDGQINRNKQVFINDEFYKKQKDNWLHTGDLVMVQSGHVGHTAVIPEELDNTAAHALIIFSNYREKVDPYFLNYQFQTHKSKKNLGNITTGNTIKHILASEMKNFQVDIPKYEEQKKIGNFFRQLDDTIILHQRELNSLENLKKSLLQQMFI